MTGRLKNRIRRQPGPRPLRRRTKKEIRRHRVLLGPVPTMLSLGNGICGLASIAMATGILMDVSPERLAFFAGLLVFGGMLFDMLDGQAARWLRQTSEFGVQLDSLCDVITFGVAPVFILLLFGEVFPARLIFGIGVIYVACVLLRLARFNVNTSDNDKHESFVGLPSPAAAGTIASFAIAMPAVQQLTEPSMPEFLKSFGTWLGMATMVFLPLMMISLALLLVSRIPYPHVVNRWMRRGYRFNDLAQSIVVVIAAGTIHELALPLVFCGFVLFPVLAAISARICPKLEPDNSCLNNPVAELAGGHGGPSTGSDHFE